MKDQLLSADFEIILSAGTGVWFIDSSVLKKVGGSGGLSVISKRRLPIHFFHHTNSSLSQHR